MATVATDGPAQRYRDAFAVGEFRAVFTAYAISMVGSVVSAVALMVLVFQRTASPFLASLTFALAFVPYLFSGTLLSATVDRLPVRRLMVLCDVMCGCLVGTMAVRGVPVGVLLLLLLAVGTLTGISGGARSAVLPTMVPSAAYIPARSLMRIASQVTQIGGNAVGGALLVVVSPRVALLVDAGSFLASAALIRIGMSARPPVHDQADARLLRDSLQGVRTVLGHAPLRRLLLLNWLVPTCGVAPEALAAPYVAGLGGPSSLVGWWLVALPLGVIAGDLIGIWLVPARWQRRLVGPLAAATFVPLLAFVLHPRFAIAFPLLVLSGSASLYGLGLDAWTRSVAPPELLGRALAINMSGLVALQGLGFAAAGALGELVS
ncbi:MAG: MFS transporter, partial [Gaiellaceae bacterium]